MKIMIIRTTIKFHEDDLTLAGCGFKVGDVVDTCGEFKDGSVCENAIRHGDGISPGDTVSVNDCEFVEL